VCATVISDEDWFLAAQQHDKKIKNIKQNLESGDQKGYKDLFQDYALKGGKVYRVTSYGLRWVGFKSRERCTMTRESGHSAADKTYQLAASQYWFPKMRHFIKKYARQCLFLFIFHN
jgi:hypothetical protein